MPYGDNLRYDETSIVNVHLDNPALQAQIDRWVSETGRSADELFLDAITGYFDELAAVRKPLTGAMTKSKAAR